MEAKFDNANNVLTANIRIAHDQSILYTLTTNQTAWKREKTYLKDGNPALGVSATAGVIHWQEKMFEVYGIRRSIADLRRKPKGFHMLSKERYWRWTNDRKEYTVCYKDEKEWQVLHNNEVVATLSVPYRPKLFGKMRPVVLNMSGCALERDEVFLLLVLVYSEAIRQDRMNASGGWQA